MKLLTWYFAVTILVSPGPIANENASSVPESADVIAKLAMPSEAAKPKLSVTFVIPGRAFDAVTDIEMVELSPTRIVSGLQLLKEFNMTEDTFGSSGFWLLLDATLNELCPQLVWIERLKYKARQIVPRIEVYRLAIAVTSLSGGLKNRIEPIMKWAHCSRPANLAPPARHGFSVGRRSPPTELNPSALI